MSLQAAVILDPQTFAAEIKAMIESTVQRETAKIPNMVVEKPMNYKEAAEFCGIKPRTLSDWVNRGWVKPYKVGKQPLFFPSEIVAQIKSKSLKSKARNHETKSIRTPWITGCGTSSRRRGKM